MEAQRVLMLGLTVAIGAAACSSEQRVVGERCPNPYVEDTSASFAPDAGLSEFYGTSCAPCDRPGRLDDRGCPIYVTFDSCGGDVCLGGVRVRRGEVSDEDAGSDVDSGVEDDAGASEEDGGAS
jgi:hypothetical protein